MNKTKIAPSILSADFAAMGKGAEDAELWGADYIHCDVMDGVFVPNITFGMPMVAALKRRCKKPLDVHLMITEPEKYVGQFADAGADIVSFHPDASKNVSEAIEMIKSKGKLAGLALNPDIALDVVKPYLKSIDLLLIMSVYAGFGGQGFIENSLQKLRDARKLIDEHGRDILLEVDGGVCENNAEAIRAAGAEILVAGSSVYKSANPAETIKILRGDIK